MIGPVKLKLERESCGACDYLKSQILKSGRNPIIDYWCTHEDAFEERMSPMKGYIGNDNKTPKWCPCR